MNLCFSTLATISLLGVAITNTSAQDAEPLGLHGSGTTSLSHCFGHIMSKFEEQIKLPSRFSYRAVGSSTGIREFLGKFPYDAGGNERQRLEDQTQTLPYTDFGAGDIPIGREDRVTSLNNGIEFVQLPFVLSAVNFFYNIPGLPLKDHGLNLTPCLLARVFERDITTWNHPKILEVNPNLFLDDDEYPIFVSRRNRGSRSTHAITNYLYQQCPQTENNPKGWPTDKVGSNIVWHPATNACEGYSGMAKCIRENDGSIGYMDATFGNDEGLSEIKLRNGDGWFLTSREAGVKGIQAATMDLSDVPNSADGDFSSVSFYNKPGPKTWPITLASYMYIRKDLSFITSPVRRNLLKAFATALFDLDYIGLCNGLVPVAEKLRDISLSGLEMLQVNNPGDASHEWKFEKSTMVGDGQGNRVISMKRKSFILNEVNHATADVSALTQRVGQLELELVSMRAKMELLLAAAADQTSSGVNDDAAASAGNESAGNVDTVNEPTATPATTAVAAVAADPISTATVVNNSSGSTDTSTIATTINQPIETEENKTAEVIDPIIADVNASFESIDDDFLPPILASSAESRLSIIWKHPTILFMSSCALFSFSF